MKQDLATARAVLADMAAGMSGKDAAAKHGVSDTWANGLVNRPPRHVRDADWYRAAVKPIKELRAKQGGRNVVVSGGRRV